MTIFFRKYGTCGELTAYTSRHRKEIRTEAATEIDASVWENMAVIEAKSLQKMLKVGEDPDIPTIMDLLLKSSWALDQPFKTVEISDKRAVLTIDRCRTQETRLSKGLPEFPCKKVRFGYLKNFERPETQEWK